ncbi:MAG: HAD family hydrolase [Promethearchaeota archaeon]|nr:MAG: HAD family hydrolase [Candidatus Lokiarchaeota archaeon]
MKFEYYLFDLDNCILLFNEPEIYFSRLFALTMEFFTNIIPNHEELKMVLTSSNINQLIEQYWKIENVDEFWHHYQNLDIQEREKLIDKGKISLDSTAIMVIKKLKKANKKIGLVTNSPRYIVDILTQKFNFSAIFDEIFSIDYENNPTFAKPSPEGINYILSRFKFNKRDCMAIMIGDSEVDIRAAKKANIFACLIIKEVITKNLDFTSWEEKPDYIIHNFTELLAL